MPTTHALIHLLNDLNLRTPTSHKQKISESIQSCIFLKNRIDIEFALFFSHLIPIFSLHLTLRAD